MGGHDAGESRRDNGAVGRYVGREDFFERPVIHGDRDMRVRGGVTMAGKMLAHRSHPRRMQTADQCRAKRPDGLRRCVQGAVADD